jgi:RNA polymerase sigma factor (sigma-70 family)
MSMRTDVEPVAEVVSGGPDGVRRLVENHRTFLRFLAPRVGSRETAEDILQAAFGRAVAHADELRDESAVAWFYRVLRNAVTDHFRREDAARRGVAAFAREIEAEVAPTEVRDAICGCVRTLAGTLKPEYAEALERVDVDGMAVKNFAAAKGITASNAGVRLSRARAALRRQVVVSCGTCAEHGCLECHCGRPASRS